MQLVSNKTVICVCGTEEWKERSGKKSKIQSNSITILITTCVSTVIMVTIHAVMNMVVYLITLLIEQTQSLVH